MVIY
jgi:peptide/nickel transport system substrate-binding protein